MNKNARKLVAALRSGEYEQTSDALRRGDSFCCLGVACEVYRLETGRGRWEPLEDPQWQRSVIFNTDAKTSYNTNDANAAILPHAVKDWLGFQTQDGTFGDSSLASENDAGADFLTIADIIENNQDLFAS